MKAIRWLDKHFEETLLIVLLVLIFCVELLQVVIRNIPWVPAMTWAEEFCRFCWIWSVFLSLPYTIRKGSMLRVTALPDVLPPRAGNVLNILADFITGAAMLLLAVHSVSVIGRIQQSGETSPAMQWPMWIIYSIMLLGFFGGTLRSVQQAVLHIRSFAPDAAEKASQKAEGEKTEWLL